MDIDGGLKRVNALCGAGCFSEAARELEVTYDQIITPESDALLALAHQALCELNNMKKKLIRLDKSCDRFESKHEALRDLLHFHFESINGA